MTVTWHEVTPIVLDLANQIIEEHHPDLLDARINFLFRSEAQVSGTRVLWGQAQKVNDKLKVFMPADFIIWLAYDIWMSLTLTQRKALIDHELCHCVWNEGPKMRSHDVEEFREIIERYGLWNSELVLLQSAMKDAKPEQSLLPGFERPKTGAVMSVGVDVAEGVIE